MSRVNRDTIAAIVLIAFTGGAAWDSLGIQTRDDGVMRATVWPHAILAVLAVLSVVYLMQSLKSEAVSPATDGPSAGSGFTGWLAYYANPIWCFALYLAFLATLPWLGMLIGGILLVFMTLNVLGGVSPRKLAFHALVSILTIGGMWAVFTYGLRVILPEGEILPLILPR